MSVHGAMNGVACSEHKILCAIVKSAIVKSDR